MANLTATPKTFEAALSFLNGRYSVKIGNNTWLESYVDGTQVDRICVRLHLTNIVQFYKDGRVTLHTEGVDHKGKPKFYRTVTTKDRINQFVEGRVFSDKRVWHYTYGVEQGAGTVLFEEGMNVNPIR